MASKYQFQDAGPPFVSPTSPPVYDVRLLSAEFQPPIVTMSDSSRATNALDANIAPLYTPVTPDDDMPEVPFRKTTPRKIVISAVVIAIVMTALAMFLGIWLGLRLRHDRQVSSSPSQTSCPLQPPCPSATNATSSETEFIGGTSFALQTNSSDTRIYYQLADGSLHVRSGVGPVTGGGVYSDALLVAPGIARINTPLAAISWSPNNFEQIRFYYIATDNQIHEICYPLAGAPFPGGLDAKRYYAAPNSRLLYAVCNYPDHPRLGFQSASTPASITEAFYTPQTGWNAAVLT